MSNVLVEVYLPANGKSYDVRIPTAVTLWEILPVLAKLLSHLSDGSFRAKEFPVLCFKDSGKICDANRTVQELGFANGTELMLI